MKKFRGEKMRDLKILKGFHPASGQGALTRIPAIWRFPVGKPTKKSE
jgi:hypothetical protein